MSHWFDTIVRRTGKEYLSYSSIKCALQDMALFELYMKGKLKKESDALTFGSAYDSLLFTPDVFDKTFHVLNDTDITKDIGGKSPRSTSLYKDWKKEQDVLAEGKTLLSLDDYKTAIDMIARLNDCGVYSIFMQGQYQVEFLQQLDVDGETIPVRGFLDVLGDGFITDSKSTRSVNGFKKDVRWLDYDVQAYLYTLAFGIKDFYWVAQEKTYPYLPAVYHASEGILDSGKQKVVHAISLIKKFCKEDTESSKFYIQGEI